MNRVWLTSILLLIGFFVGYLSNSDGNNVTAQQNGEYQIEDKTVFPGVLDGQKEEEPQTTTKV